MKFYYKLLCFLPLGLIASCGIGNESAGNTTEIENAIAIRLFDSGEPAAKVRYQVLPSWYVADTAEASTISYTYEGSTDTNGWVHIDGHKDGSYTINFSNFVSCFQV